MKCIKCIKVAKGYELDEVRRIADIDADEKVKVNEVVNEQPKEELSIEEKKLKRKKNDKK